MPFYADCLRKALAEHCEVIDVHLEPDLAYQIAGATGLRVQDYVGRFWSLPRQLSNLKADIFHIVDHANAHLIRALDPARTVITCHDLMLLKLAAGEIHGLNEQQPWIASKAFRWSVNHLPKAAAVLCDSESTRDDVERLVGCLPEHLYVVYLGVEENFKRISDCDILDQTCNRFGIASSVKILHVGKNTFYKNLEGIIEALALLSPVSRDHTLFVKVGRDITPAQRDLIRRRGLSDRVHILGQLSIGDLALLYNISSLLLFPSLYEGFGFPPLEAMACGVPVVCSDRGSLKEIVGNSAYIVDPEDPRSIAHGVEQVLTDEILRKELIARGLERSRDFTWKNTAEQVLNVYERILSVNTN